MTDFKNFLELLIRYNEEYGNLLVPANYVTSSGIKLGRKVRYVRKGEIKLSEDEKKKLDEIGFVWRLRDVYRNFDDIYIMLKEYKKQFGNLKITHNYITPKGISLGRIVSYIRTGKHKVSDSERKKLNELGFIWNTRAMYSFEETCELLEEYKKQNGNMLIPIKYITESGVPLGVIVNNIRQGNRKTTLEERKKLDEIGFIWHVRSKKLSFNALYQFLVEYKEKYGNLDVCKNYVTDDGIALGKMVCSIRNGDRRVNKNQRDKLNAIGFEWKGERSRLSFEELYLLLVKYQKEYGNLKVPHKYETIDGIKLGKRVYELRKGKRRINAEQKEMLDELGFLWHLDYKVTSFDEIYNMLVDYKKEYGHLKIPRTYVTKDGRNLGTLANSLRYGARKITDEQKEVLINIGFVFSI